MLSSRQRILALALAAVGACALWLQRGKEIPGPVTADRERRPDYTVDNFSLTTMDEYGVPHRSLTAIELRHYADDGSKELEAPDLTLHMETGLPWQIRSETAWISGDNKRIRMQGKVWVDRGTGATTRPVHMETRDLLLQRDENYARTDQPVWIRTPVGRISAAGGARVWLGTKLRVKLSGPVRGRTITPRTGQEDAPMMVPNDRPRLSQ